MWTHKEIYTMAEEGEPPVEYDEVVQQEYDDDTSHHHHHHQDENAEEIHHHHLNNSNEVHVESDRPAKKSRRRYDNNLKAQILEELSQEGATVPGKIFFLDMNIHNTRKVLLWHNAE